VKNFTISYQWQAFSKTDVYQQDIRNRLETLEVSDDIDLTRMPAELTEFDFAVEDELDGRPLTPDNVSLPILRGFLGEVETFAKGDLPGITLAESKVRIQEGSLKVQMFVGAALAFSIQGDLEKLKQTGDLDLIHAGRAKIIETWQNRAEKSSKRNYSIGADRLSVRINGQSNYEHGNEKAWVNVEKYFTGKIFNAGGKQEPNVHIQLDNGQVLRVDATEQQLSAKEDNVLFKTVTLRVRAEQHLRTKALRKLQLVEFVPVANELDEDALAVLWKKGPDAWKEIDSAVDWVERMRGHK
jgi:hypothetical protein